VCNWLVDVVGLQVTWAAMNMVKYELFESVWDALMTLAAKAGLSVEIINEADHLGVENITLHMETYNLHECDRGEALD
jgi:hypothetical protein